MILNGYQSVTHHPAMLSLLEGPELTELFRRFFNDVPSTFSNKWCRVMGTGAVPPSPNVSSADTPTLDVRIHSFRSYTGKCYHQVPHSNDQVSIQMLTPTTIGSRGARRKCTRAGYPSEITLSSMVHWWCAKGRTSCEAMTLLTTRNGKSNYLLTSSRMRRKRYGRYVGQCPP